MHEDSKLKNVECNQSVDTTSQRWETDRVESGRGLILFSRFNIRQNASV